MGGMARVSRLCDDAMELVGDDGWDIPDPPSLSRSLSRSLSFFDVRCGLFTGEAEGLMAPVINAAIGVTTDLRKRCRRPMPVMLLVYGVRAGCTTDTGSTGASTSSNNFCGNAAKAVQNDTAAPPPPPPPPLSRLEAPSTLLPPRLRVSLFDAKLLLRLRDVLFTSEAEGLPSYMFCNCPCRMISSRVSPPRFFPPPSAPPSPSPLPPPATREGEVVVKDGSKPRSNDAFALASC